MEMPVSQSVSSLGLIADMVFLTFLFGSSVRVGNQSLFVAIWASGGLVILIVCLDFHLSAKDSQSSAVILSKSQSQTIAFGVGKSDTFR